MSLQTLDLQELSTNEQVETNGGLVLSATVASIIGVGILASSIGIGMMISYLTSY